MLAPGDVELETRVDLGRCLPEPPAEERRDTTRAVRF